MEQFVVLKHGSVTGKESIVVIGSKEECEARFNKEVTSLVMRGFKPMEASESPELYLLMAGTGEYKGIEITLNLRRRLRGESIED